MLRCVASRLSALVATRCMTESIASNQRQFSALPESARLFVFRMPKLSHAMNSGKITTWFRKPGDSFGDSDIICNIASDNVVEVHNKLDEWAGEVTLEIESQDEGYLAAILQEDKHPGPFKVGEPLAIVCEEEEHVRAVQGLVKEGKTDEVLKSATRDIVWQAYRKRREGEEAKSSGSCM